MSSVFSVLLVIMCLLMLCVQITYTKEYCVDEYNGDPILTCASGTVLIQGVQMAISRYGTHVGCLSINSTDCRMNLSIIMTEALITHCHGKPRCLIWYQPERIVCDGRSAISEYMVVTYTCYVNGTLLSDATTQAGKDSTTTEVYTNNRTFLSPVSPGSTTLQPGYMSTPLTPTESSSSTTGLSTSLLLKVGFGIGGSLLLIGIIACAYRCACHNPRKRKRRQSQQNPENELSSVNTEILDQLSQIQDTHDIMSHIQAINNNISHIQASSIQGNIYSQPLGHDVNSYAPHSGVTNPVVTEHIRSESNTTSDFVQPDTEHISEDDFAQYHAPPPSYNSVVQQDAHRQTASPQTPSAPSKI